MCVSHSPNPVVRLFTGHCRTEGSLEGQTFVNESDFGAFPIQVQGHTHLHDSLEAACVSSEMGQEVGRVPAHVYRDSIY